MKISSINWRKSIFFRLIITFIVALIPIYMLGVYTYNWGINTVREKIANSILSQISFYINTLEMDIEKTGNLLYESLNNIDINGLATISPSMNDIDKYRSILRVQQHLLAIRNSSPYIESVSVHVPLLGRTIKSDDITDALEYGEYNLVIGHNSTDYLKLIIYDNNRILMFVKYPIVDESNKKDPIFVLTAELSKEKIESALTKINNSESRLIMYDSSKKILLSDKKNSVNFSIEDIMKILPGMTQTSGYLFGSNKGVKYMIAYTWSKQLDMFLVKYVPQEYFLGELNNYKIWFCFFSVIVFIIITLFSITTFGFIHKPLLKLAESLNDVENGNLSISILHKEDNEFRYIFNQFNSMVKKIDMLVNQIYLKEILMQRAQLKQLQTQINPHFLYNSFFTLCRLAKIEDYETIIRFSNQLGEYFRFITRNGADEIPLATEIKHARAYSEIQELRFADRIKVDFEDLPSQYSNMPVPRLIIQPLLENAFMHGLENKESNGWIHIRFRSFDDTFSITIEDNGKGLDERELERLNRIFAKMDEDVESTGIININKRLKLRFGSGSGLILTNNEFGGVRVSMNIKVDFSMKAGNDNV